MNNVYSKNHSCWATNEMRGERIITTTQQTEEEKKNRQTQLILYYLTRTEPTSPNAHINNAYAKIYVCEFTRIKRARWAAVYTYETRNTSCCCLRKCHWNEKYVMLFFVGILPVCYIYMYFYYVYPKCLTYFLLHSPLIWWRVADNQVWMSSRLNINKHV